MELWCSATGEPWTWAWRPYPGVWAFVAATATGLVVAWRTGPARSLEERAADRRSIRRLTLGMLVLWLALDWPVGALGSGYLASVHMLQFLLLTFVAVPLLVSGVPAWMMQRAAPGGVRLAVLRALARPLVALAVFNVIMVVTHVPQVVDLLMGSQLGSLTIDMAWLLGAVALWLPVLGTHDDVPRLSAPVAMAYLFGQSVVGVIPASFLVYWPWPVYAVYELAPPVPPITSRVDQQLAGFGMSVVGNLLLWARIAWLWFTWSAQAARGEPMPGGELAPLAERR